MVKVEYRHNISVPYRYLYADIHRDTETDRHRDTDRDRLITRPPREDPRLLDLARGFGTNLRIYHADSSPTFSYPTYPTCFIV